MTSKSINSEIVLTSQSSAPTAQTGLLYYDDGTNTTSGDANFRFYDGQGYRDLTTGAIEIAIFGDRRSTSTAGGSYTATTAVVRALTTVKSQSWASLSSNQITIDGANYPGRYVFEWRGHCYRADGNWHFLENTSGPTIVGLGTSTYSATATDATRCISNGYYEDDITTSITYEIYFQAETNSVNVNGKGVAHTLNSPDPETYCYVYITRYPT